MEEQEIQPFSLADLATVELGTLIPIAQAMGFPEAVAATRQQITGIVYAAQRHDPEALAALHERVKRIQVNRENKQRSGSLSNITTNKDGSPRGKSAVFGAVAMVHKIADKMKDSPRADVIAECVSQGINKNTAATQYAAWRRQQTSPA